MRMHLLAAALLGAAWASGAQAQDIEPFQAQSVEPSRAEEAKLRPAAGGVCTAAAPATLFLGRARNGAYTGKLELEVMAPDATGRTTANFTAYDGLAGDGQLTGTFRHGRLSLAGTLRAGIATSWRMVLEGRVDGAGRLSGAYELEPLSGATRQRGEFNAAGSTGLDPRVVGGWAMTVPSAVYSVDHDRGSYLERVQHASVGALGGALVVLPDGRYTWKKQGGTSTGRLSYCATPGGNAGWTATYDGERFFLRFIPVQNGGFSLFSMAGSHVYSGTPIPR